jgi:hypothetical protein
VSAHPANKYRISVTTEKIIEFAKIIASLGFTVQETEEGFKKLSKGFDKPHENPRQYSD